MRKLFCNYCGKEIMEKVESYKKIVVIDVIPNGEEKEISSNDACNFCCNDAYYKLGDSKRCEPIKEIK